MIMGNLHLVTGYAGIEHITAADQGAFQAALLGASQFVLGKGNKLSATVIDNNTIRVLDGDIMMQGRYIRLNEGSYVDVAIENGTQGYYRNDLIVARYTKDTITGVEDCNLVVIKGTAASSSPTDPEYTSGNIISDHAVANDMPLYRVPLNGLNVGTLVCLFSTFEDTLLSLLAAVSGKAETTHYHAATAITSGTLAVARGGTGKGSYTANRLLYPSAETTLAQLAFPAAAGSVLRQNTSGAPFWTSLADLATAMGAAKIETGSYIGTGTTYNSLNFSAPPKFVAICHNSDNGQLGIFVVGVQKYALIQPGSGSSSNQMMYYCAQSINGNKLTWSHSGVPVGDPTYALNISGITYKYIALL